MSDEFSSTTDALMSINDLYCTFNSPKAAKGEQVSGLPPYAQRRAFLVDEYPGCPTNWMHGSALAKSYFVPIQAEHGMWLDFNGCWSHTHHVAVLISVQGVNPLTGLPMVDQALHLEQYREKCPHHDVPFQSDLFCPECGYKWCPQNYLCTTGTPQGMFWLDGFRADDGTVRQYYFTEEECKGVATQIIGDKRVYAIGVAFYLSKEAKPPKPTTPVLRPLESLSMNADYHWKSVQPKYMIPRNSVAGGSSVKGDIATFKRISAPHKKLLSKGMEESSFGKLCDSMPDNVNVHYDGHESVSSNLTADSGVEMDFDSQERLSEITPTKQLEIGAGAKISQKVYRDPESLDYWQEKPAGMLYINYVDVGTTKRIIAVGKIDMTKGGEGFLAGLQKGNK